MTNSMKTIHINTASPYDVHIGSGLLNSMGKLLPEKILRGAEAGGKAVLITDTNVEPLYGERVSKSLEKLGFHVLKAVIPAGEESKSGEQYLRLLSFMAADHVSRSDVIFALGGGVTGDMAGFLAATYQRGIDFAQLPTTLLAAVDSSVGGKTAINLPEGKNLVGAFKQPACVIMDTDTLKTLPEDVFADGCAEVIKYGMIWDAVLFEELQNHVLVWPDCRGDDVLMADIIARCVDIKRQVVVQDEEDRGIRNMLNFGHTIGHSIEKNSHFEIRHGQAVAMGMMIVTEAAEKAGICQAGVTAQLRNLLTACNLPTEAPYSMELLLEGMRSDKKIQGQEINLILPQRIGQCIIRHMTLTDAQKLLAGEA